MGVGCRNCEARALLFWVNTPATFRIELTVETNQTTQGRVRRLLTGASAVQEIKTASRGDTLIHGFRRGTTGNDNMPLLGDCIFDGGERKQPEQRHGQASDVEASCQHLNPHPKWPPLERLWVRTLSARISR